MSQVEKKLQKLLTEGKKRNHDHGLDINFSDYDPNLLESGSIVFRKHFFSMFVSMLSGLLTLLYIPSIVDVLEKTGQSSTPEASFKRYLRTLNNVIKWYDLGLESRIQSLKHVRKTHANVAKKEIMTQYDMVLTQWAFIAPALLMPQELGMDPISQEELKALKYVIFVVGQAIGIDNDLNLCHGDLDHTLEYSQLILDQIIQPALKTESQQSQKMADNLLQGMHFLNPYLIPSSFKAWAFKLFQVPQKRLETSVSFRLLDALFSSWLHGFLGSILRPLLSQLMITNVFLANRWQDHIMVSWRRPIMTSIVTAGIICVLIVVPLTILFMLLKYMY